MRKLISSALLFAALGAAVSGCSPTAVSDFVKPYRIDIRQGNYVTQEMVAQLKPGMSRDQVRFVLGTPLVTDVFHSDRWDYVYRFRPGKGDTLLERRLTVIFAGDSLARLEGDVRPEDAAAKPQ
ncbi:outer membrane protein assembly factor BamE [uncultured Zoogloea sp.]|uniref:outer membrane protein assembly factor BamE n=1 Tax=uncultured Zoogloea sp. TaxID=160237 RepID=UPI00261E0401|nr:outer membrane protein assembly factor BamE [uncultured Zoogloea sp.]